MAWLRHATTTELYTHRKMIHLDGAYGEGGGQILRTALVLSLLTGQPFRIDDIRRGRPISGLKPQHLHIVKALLQMSDARADGVAPGSLSLAFWPGHLRPGDYRLDVGTAGAIPLMLQTLLPASMFAAGRVRWSLIGGTDVRGAMTMDFWQQVLAPFLQNYAAGLELRTERPGYYPAGGGRVSFTVEPALYQGDWPRRAAQMPPLALAARGELRRVRIWSRASASLADRRVAERQAAACVEVLGTQAADVQVAYGESHSPGSSLTAVAEYAHTRLGADALGERGKPAEEVGRAAAQRLQTEMAAGGTVDMHTADNLLLWVALFGGGFTVDQVSGHLATNAWVIDQFLPHALTVEGATVGGARAVGRVSYPP